MEIQYVQIMSYHVQMFCNNQSVLTYSFCATNLQYKTKHLHDIHTLLKSECIYIYYQALVDSFLEL